MKTLVLVLGARAAPYPALIRTIKQTWASEPFEGVDTLFYYGGRAHSLDHDDLVLPVPDGPLDIGRKTIACFEWCLEHRDFDLVFRTNCSSYVDLPNLCAYVSGHARGERFYSGLIGMVRDLAFASGSGYFLSRDLVELVVSEQSSWDHKLIDDAALADVLGRHGVHPEPAPRVDVRDARERKFDLSQFHFRCRTGSWRRREDIRIMRNLHRAFVESRD